MHPAVEGALVGLGVGLFLVGTEYVLLRKAVNERAQRYKRKAEFDITEQRRMRMIWRFAVVLPAAFALGFWVVS